MRRSALCLTWMSALTLVACAPPDVSGSPRLAADAGAADSGEGGVQPAPDWSHLPPVVNPDPELALLTSRQAQYDNLCATRRGDSFFKLVCGGARPAIPDLQGLLNLVGLGQQRAFALTGNSTSLVTKSVSALNPRILVFPRVKDTLDRPDTMIAVGFVRGEQFVEIASSDLETHEPNFYLLSFEQACSYQGCDLAGLLTEEIEHNWTAYSIYTDQDLENTSMACRTCHQPGGPSTPKILRMQELESSWLHWFPQRFVQRTNSDRVLTAQFLGTHDVDVQYGGVPVSTIANAIDEGGGALLEALVRSEGFGTQPNAFDPRIEAEANNVAGAVSPTWLPLFQAAVRGDAIAVPYPRADVTDPAKRASAVQSYRDVVTKAASRDTLTDVRAVFSQDAEEKLGFVPQPGSDGRTVLTQMCTRCHDGRADPAVNRSRFDVRKLDQMSRAEKDLALLRIQASEGNKLRMPPWRAGRLTPEALQAGIAELSK